jgi:hypothetical protein
VGSDTQKYPGRLVQLAPRTPQTPPKSRKRASSDELIYLQTPANRKELRKTVETLRKSEQEEQKGSLGHEG